MFRIAIKRIQPGFHGGDIAQDACLGYIRQNIMKRIECIFQRYGINHHFRGEIPNFFRIGHSDGVIRKAQFLWIGIEDRDFVIETEHIGKERSHFAGSKSTSAKNDPILPAPRINIFISNYLKK
ncbi:MAG: hypothetical protein BWZ06_01964 [Bacteroidetes bacterium ADurb.BinA261]|nr:MAG: hypothetical protein BWZ06_01964 [Bacteroidetes bacterium ADurb.BinA261]